MNKLRALLMSYALVIGLSLPCFADQAQGLIESVDSSKNSILIKDPVSGEEKTVHVHPKVIAEVKKGSVVKATFQSGSGDADTFEVLIPKNR